jgi:hypothetical protein
MRAHLFYSCASSMPHHRHETYPRRTYRQTRAHATSTLGGGGGEQGKRCTNTRDREVCIYKYTRSKMGQAERRRGKERSSSELLSCKSRRKAHVDVSRTSSVICAALIFDSAATQQFVKLATVSLCFSVSLSVFHSR